MKPMNILNKLNESESRWSNEDFELICEKLGLVPSDAMGGVIRFDNVDINVLLDLIEEGYVDTSDRQNYGRSIQEIVDFYHYNSIDKDVTNFKVGGYVVVPTRRDCRLTIDGVEFDYTDDIAEEVKEFVKDGDEVSLNNFHASVWWD